MTGRIGIDDIEPAVSGGRFPAKAVVGEVVPVRATVWREGHDAVAATLVVRYHGSSYPRLTTGPQGVSLPAVPIEAVLSHSGEGEATGVRDVDRAGHPTCSMASSFRTPLACGPSGWTAGATR